MEDLRIGCKFKGKEAEVYLEARAEYEKEACNKNNKSFILWLIKKNKILKELK